MIFISYRREDAAAVVTSLHRGLSTHFGAANIFVDTSGIPPGESWPDRLRESLDHCSVLLAVVGPKWATIHSEADDSTSRPRLYDPTDWVRKEICYAIQNNKKVIVLLVDGAKWPQMWWDCELDELHRRQHLEVRNHKDFDRDFGELCRHLEEAHPELKRAISLQREPLPTSDAPTDEHLLAIYLAAELSKYSSIQLPIISKDGHTISAPVDDLRIDLPLIITREHLSSLPDVPSLWAGRDPTDVNDEWRGTHSNALWVDRASRFEDIHRDCDIAQRLQPASRIVILGDPGSGKSTLLQWLARTYALYLAPGTQDGPIASQDHPLPAQRWLPIMIVCRELAKHPLPSRFEDLLRLHLQLRQFSNIAVEGLVRSFEQLFEQGRALLLVDGLDEIPDPAQRLEFCTLLTSIADRFPNTPIIVTSRIVGFLMVDNELASRFDRLQVAPLDRRAKQDYIDLWAKVAGWSQSETDLLVQRATYSRAAKLTDTILMLTIVAQMQSDLRPPWRRVDIYRSAVKLMLQRRRQFTGPPLNANELLPHLEFLAYRMRKQQQQRCSEKEAVEAFRELRLLEPDEPVLQTRSCEDLLRACIHSLGLLTVAGTEIDRRGYERQMVQFFHQSFQEYFAGQAILHERDMAGPETTAARLRALIVTGGIIEREVSLWDQYMIKEPVILDYWQETVRMAIADLQPGEADEAVLMLLPTPDTEAREARPRAVFALQCLADEPRVNEHTVLAVLDAAINCLQEGDGFNTKLNTLMDEAIAAVVESSFGQLLRGRFIQGFIDSRGDRRHLIGSSMLASSRPDDLVVKPENAEALIAYATAGLDSDRQADRIWTAADLVNRFFLTGGKLDFLTSDQQQRLWDALLSALTTDEATECAVMWAFGWFTGALHRGIGIPRAKANEEGTVQRCVYMASATVPIIEAILQRPGLDTNTVRYGCVVLTREQGLTIVSNQRDWLLESAKVADGIEPRHRLPPLIPTVYASSRHWMLAFLPELPSRHSVHIALALGSFGIYSPQMVDHLWFGLTQERFDSDIRNEASIYLAFTGTPEAIQLLITAADTPYTGDESFLADRGLLGLILVDNVDVLAEQIRKAVPHSDLRAYAYCMASSSNPRGRLLLEQLEDDPNERIRSAVSAALSHAWDVSP